MDIHIRYGKAALEIICDVMAFDYDRGMKTAVGRDGLAERFFGDNALKLIRKWPYPVWIGHLEGLLTPRRVRAASKFHMAGICL